VKFKPLSAARSANQSAATAGAGLTPAGETEVCEEDPQPRQSRQTQAQKKNRTGERDLTKDEKGPPQGGRA
jgi:hypothetical protein